MASFFDPRPQPGETNIGYGLRSIPIGILNGVTRPFMPGNRLDLLHGGFLNALTNEAYNLTGHVGITRPEVEKGLAYALAPATGPAPPATPPGAKPFSGPANSYKDSSWNEMDSIGAARAGMPQLANMLFAIRTRGERSNNDQVSTAGARTVYQITPETRNLFKKKYGVDAYASPQDAATVAALHLKESMERGEDPIRGYIGGPDTSKWGPQTEAYAGRVYGPNMSAFKGAANAVGLNQPMPAFDPSGYQQANSLLGQVAANQMRPFSAQYTETPLPELPKPELMQAPDYSAGDAALAAAQPKNPFGATPEEQAKGQLKLRRGDYFAGMAQALASIDWSNGPGLGELFAKLGAGAVMGAKAGDSEVQDRMDKFDEAMQRYQMAVANRDDAKARDAANVANQNIAAMNQYKQNQWKVAAQDVEKHNPRIENGVLTTFNKQPDGTIIETHTPLDPARQTAALMGQANIAMAQGNAHNEYAWQTYRANRELAGAALPYALADAEGKGNTAGRDGIFAVGLAEGANAATETGQWSTLYQRYLPGGAEMAASRQREAYIAAGLPVDDQGNLLPGTKLDKDSQTAINNYLSTKMMEDFVNMGHSWVLTGGPVFHKETGRSENKQPAPETLISVSQQREKNRTRSSSTDSRGRTTYRERYD